MVFTFYLLGDSTDVKSEPASPDEDSSRAHFGKQASYNNYSFFVCVWSGVVGETLDQEFFLSRPPKVIFSLGFIGTRRVY